MLKREKKRVEGGGRKIIADPISMALGRKLSTFPLCVPVLVPDFFTLYCF